MLSHKKLQAMKILKEQYSEIDHRPIHNCGVTVGLIEKNIFIWRATLIGAKDTPYEGGFFILRIEFTDDYPMCPPKIRFLTPIYHPNVSIHGGNVSIIYRNGWNPEITGREILAKLFTIFYKINPDSPYEYKIAEEYKKDRALYIKKVQYFVKKYADVGVSYKNSQLKEWDFSYETNELYSDKNQNNNEVNINSNNRDKKDNVLEKNLGAQTTYQKPINEINGQEVNQYNSKIDCHKDEKSKENKIMKVIFDYNGKKNIIIQCKNNTRISDTFNIFKNIFGLIKEKSKLFYYYNSKRLNHDVIITSILIQEKDTINVVDESELYYAI